MVKSPSVRRSADFDPHPNKSSRSSESLPFKHAFETLARVLAPATAAEAVVITTMPRGSLQIAQPARLSEALLKAYARDFHLEDRLTWQAVLNRKPARPLNPPARFFNEYLQAAGFTYAVAVPLEAPVLEGYPGALHVYRKAEDGDFTAEEIRQIQEIARDLDDAIRESRAARISGSACAEDVSLTPRPAVRQFVFDAQARELFAPDQFTNLDDSLRNNVLEYVRSRIAKRDGQVVSADRVQLPDSRGDLWTFRVVTYSRYPAIAPDGPIVLLCMQPTCGEWGAVRPADLQADTEIARLIPAIKFMKQEFHRGPTLGEIAKTVHLSPFHFHRRFAELLGMTPKHYLLECQIHEAKVQLLARRKELAEIATDCGFAHQSHFTSRFKQATGLTPTRWRKLALEARQIGESN